MIAALSDPGLDIAYWAQQALYHIGSSIVPALQESLATMQGLGQHYANELLSKFPSTSGLQAHDYKWVDDDEGLVLFAWIGHTLLQKVTSIKGLSRQLAQLKQDGVWNHSYTTGDTSIKLVLSTLERKFSAAANSNIELLKIVNRRVVGLTSDGAAILNEVTAYLKSKSAFVQPGNESAV